MTFYQVKDRDPLQTWVIGWWGMKSSCILPLPRGSYKHGLYNITQSQFGFKTQIMLFRCGTSHSTPWFCINQNLILHISMALSFISEQKPSRTQCSDCWLIRPCAKIDHFSLIIPWCSVNPTATPVGNCPHYRRQHSRLQKATLPITSNAYSLL